MGIAFNYRIRSPLEILQAQEDVAREVLDLDSSILHVTFADDHGNVVARESKDSDSARFQFSPEVTRMWGVWEVIIVSVAKQLDPYMSRTQFIVIAREDYKCILVPLGSRNLVAGIVVRASTESRYIYDKIAAFFGPN